MADDAALWGLRSCLLRWPEKAQALTWYLDGLDVDQDVRRRIEFAVVGLLPATIKSDVGIWKVMATTFVASLAVGRAAGVPYQRWTVRKLGLQPMGAVCGVVLGRARWSPKCMLRARG
jgi:hypothetical protein